MSMASVVVLGRKARTRSLLVPLLVILLTLLPMAGCGGDSASIALNPLEIIGDVDNPLALSSMKDGPEAITIEHRGKRISAYALDDLLEEAVAWGMSFSVMFQSHDGFVAHIDGENIDKSYIALTAENGWEAINFNHPVSSNIKNLKRVVVIADDLTPEEMFHVIKPDGTLASLSVGALFRDGYSYRLIPRGSATQTRDGLDYNVTTYYRRPVVQLEDYADITSSAVVVGKLGEVETLRQDGIFVLTGNGLGYMAGGEMIIPQAAGVVLNPPAKMITSVYHDAKALLESGEKVLVILVDGFGYHQYEYAKEQGHIPFLSTLPPPEMAMSAFPSITPVNVAASLTGELPHINGVVSRNVRRADVPTIFAWCLDQGLNSAAVIGPISAIEFEIDAIFSLDLNQDGSTDDEKTENALGIIGEGYDLVFVHYKDVDIAGHSYGDLHRETMEALRGNDAYIEELLSQWQGAVIIYADHGMRSTEDGGDHGALLSEDMFIPYWIFHTNQLQSNQD